MKRPISVFMCIWLVAALFSCKKEVPENKVDSELLAQVVGRYEWIFTVSTIYDQSAPPSAQYWTPTDSTDRVGMVILGSGEVVLYKNGASMNSGNVSETRLGGNNTIYVSCKLVAGNFSASVKGDELTNSSIPYKSEGGGPITNRFKRLSTNASLSLEHGQPDCSAGYGICGSYKGEETKWSLQYPFEKLPHEIKTYHLVPGNPLSCDVYVLNASGNKVLTVLNTPVLSVSVNDSMLYIEKYWYAIDQKLPYYRFVGKKE